MGNVFVSSVRLKLKHCFSVTSFFLFNSPSSCSGCKTQNCRFICKYFNVYGKQSNSDLYAASSLNSLIYDQNNFPSPAVVLGFLFLCCWWRISLRDKYYETHSAAHLTLQQDIYNEKLSQARRCVGCAFKILVNKWRLMDESY